MDILPRLLLPLAGPTPDSLDDEDVDKLPIDLQYLDEDKKIEEDPDIRKLIAQRVINIIKICCLIYSYTNNYPFHVDSTETNHLEKSR